MDLEQRVLDLEKKFERLQSEVNSLDTQLNAAEQALYAMTLGRRNQEKLTGFESVVNQRFDLISKALYKAEKLIQTLACSIAGAVLLWIGNPLVHDANELNDKIAYPLFLTGMGFLGYGLLVLTENEKIVLGLVSKINPWSK